MTRTSHDSLRARSERAVLWAFAGALALGALLPLSLGAQAAAPDTLRACYVPGSGTVYRIKTAATPAACTNNSHVAFEWVDGDGALRALPTNAAGALDFANTAGLVSASAYQAGDDVPTPGIPTTGPGRRLMWYPGKAAFRAGQVTGAEWDDANVGVNSVAFGFNARASGGQSLAIGQSAVASGPNAQAFGPHALASGQGATAIGSGTRATGASSVAMGSWASTNGRTGSFVYGDFSSSTEVEALGHNQFVVRAQRFWFGNNNAVTATPGRFIETHTGAYLSSGGVWTNVSDSAKKSAYRPVDGEQVLAKLAAVPVRTWSYTAESDTVRHMGPTAQDFRRAFGLGDTDKAIATVDADGVSLAAAQALELRTRAQADSIAALTGRVRSLQATVDQLTLSVNRLATREDGGAANTRAHDEAGTPKRRDVARRVGHAAARLALRLAK